MLTPSTLLTLPAALAAISMRAWSVDHRARRNAMVAATACAERRAQREDVADYLARRTAAGRVTLGADAPTDRAAEA